MVKEWIFYLNYVYNTYKGGGKMKFIKLFSFFIIFYFGIIALDSLISLAKWLSFGRIYIEYGFYVFMVLLFFKLYS